MPKTPSAELVNLWQQLANHTLKKCGPPHCNCTRETRCCDCSYCDMTKEYAKDRYGVELQKTDHPTLPFMGLTGCTVAPHLRPLCTLHQCDINSIGVLRGDNAWTQEYFRLREQVEIQDFTESDS